MSLDKTIITKRLTYIKYLYQQGVEQSKLPEVIAGFALMQFHDSIEMFLLLVAENLGKKNTPNGLLCNIGQRLAL